MSPSSLDIKNTSHLAGSYTVKIRPWSAAQLNPERRPLCLPTSTPMPNSSGLSEALRYPVGKYADPVVAIPLSLSGSGPWTVTFLRNNVFYKDTTIKSTNEKTMFDLQVDRTGMYQIGKVIDGNGTEGRVTGDGALVLPCPQARIDGLVVQHGIEMCHGTTFPIKIWLAGQEPFIISFDLVSDGGVENIVIPDLKPTTASSGVFKMHTYHLKGSERHTQFLLRVASIQDSQGRLHRYGDWDSGDSVIVDLMSPPRIMWNHGSSFLPKLLETQKSTNLSVKITGAAPFEYVVKNPDGATLSIKDVPGPISSFQARLPGTYKLLSIKDSLCFGSIDLPQELTLQAVHPPTLHAEVEPLKSLCKGDMGLSFQLELTGEGPWKLQAKQSKKLQKGAFESQTFFINVPTPRHRYVWQPQSPGFYELSFTLLSDANYNNISLKKFSYNQEIVPPPGAEFIGGRELFDCVGNSPLINVNLQGIGPWKIDYSLAFPDSRVQNFKTESELTEFFIKFDQFKLPGRYLVSLLSVSDSTGCVSNLVAQSATISVFPNVPTLGFKGKDSIFRIREGTDDTVPLVISANKPPITLTLLHFPLLDSSTSQQLTFKLDSQVRGLQLKHPGRYEISRVRDEFCVGNSVDSRSIVVEILPQPTAEFDPENIPWSCRGTPSNRNEISVKVKGTGTVSVGFTVKYSMEESELKHAQKDRKVKTGKAPLIILTEEKIVLSPGFYQYDLVSISDSVFPERTLKLASVVQQVFPDPAPRISSVLHNNLFCYDPTIKSFGPFLFDFTGSGISKITPVQFKYEVLHDGKVREVVEASSNQATIPMEFHVDALNRPGSYHVNVTQVKNSYGCVWTAPSQALSSAVKDLSALPIVIVERPSLTLTPERESLCVGDIAHFELFGTGAWTVSYTLKDAKSKKQKSDTTSANRLNVLLAEPGTLSIDSVCNKHCCANLPSSGLSYPIYELPSASISDGVQFVREGEEAEFTVAIKGTPPFSFTYQQIDESNGQVVDTVHVKDINLSQHRVKVTASGTFRVVSIQDRNCRYPKKH